MAASAESAAATADLRGGPHKAIIDPAPSVLSEDAPRRRETLSEMCVLAQFLLGTQCLSVLVVSLQGRWTRASAIGLCAAVACAPAGVYRRSRVMLACCMQLREAMCIWSTSVAAHKVYDSTS